MPGPERHGPKGRASGLDLEPPAGTNPVDPHNREVSSDAEDAIRGQKTNAPEEPHRRCAIPRSRFSRCLRVLTMLTLVCAFAAPLLRTAPAAATTPGRNGRIVFSRADGAIYSIDPDGTGIRRLVGRAGFPAWSPNGRWLAFSRLGETNGAWNMNIWVAKLNGTGLRQLTFASSPSYPQGPTSIPHGRPTEPRSPSTRSRTTPGSRRSRSSTATARDFAGSRAAETTALGTPPGRRTASGSPSSAGVHTSASSP